MAEHDLEALYREAESALKARDYDRAAELLKQILLEDHEYKDVSRLLAETVRFRRRKWYNHPLLWGAMGLLAVVALGFSVASRLQGLYAVEGVPPIASPSMMILPPKTEVPTDVAMSSPTPIPLAWKRVSLGQVFPRDTVAAIVIDPKDPDVLYAGMENAGIYKSIDGGLSWQPSHFGVSNSNAESLAIDPQNPQILYAGTMGGIFKTEDGGGNWSRIGEGNYILMDPQNSAHLYARDSDNIYESTDQGKSWEAVYSSKTGCPSRMYSWVIHPTDGNTLFIAAGGDCEPGIYASTDRGYTWKPLWLLQRTQNYLIEIAALSVGLDREGNYYFHFGLRRSGPRYSALIHNDSGIWRTLFEFEPPAAFDTTGSVYFECDTFLCKFDLDEKERLRLGKPEVGALTLIAISPHDPNTIYIAGEGIAISKDGGQTWSKRSNGLGGMRLTLETGEGTPPTLYLQQEEECNIINNLNQGLPIPGQPLYTSNDGGRTWDLATELGCFLIKDTKETTLYRMGMVQQNPWIWRSQDGGISWIQLFTPHKPDAVAFQGPLLYLYWEDVLLDGKPYHWEYISKDYGREWRVVDPFIDAKLCYGSTLQFVDAYRPMAIDPFDGNHVFVIDNGILLESHDSCDTTETFATAPNRSMNSIVFDPNKSDVIYAGTDSGAYVSFDGGENWNAINDGLLGATVVYSIVVDKEGNVYAATPYGIFKLENR